MNITKIMNIIVIMKISK